MSRHNAKYAYKLKKIYVKGGGRARKLRKVVELKLEGQRPRS
jgi:hypothetical protein